MDDDLQPLVTICERCGTIRSMDPAEEIELMRVGLVGCSCSYPLIFTVTPNEVRADIYYNRVWKRDII